MQSGLGGHGLAELVQHLLRRPGRELLDQVDAERLGGVGRRRSAAARWRRRRDCRPSACTSSCPRRAAPRSTGRAAAAASSDRRAGRGQRQSRSHDPLPACDPLRSPQVAPRRGQPPPSRMPTSPAPAPRRRDGRPPRPGTRRPRPRGPRSPGCPWRRAPASIMTMMKAPTKEPTMVPWPPKIEVPPMNTAASTVSR